jgi:hypothetical protein
MSSGFTKIFRLTALVLLVSVMNVYVMAHPRATSNTFATKNTESANKPVVTDHQLNFIKQNQVTPQAQLASERSITFAPKSPLSMAFTKSTLEKSATRTAFLKIQKGTYDLMVTPKGMNRAADDSDDDDDDNHKALIIVSAIVIGAAVAAFIGFRHDRDDDGIRGQ